MENVAFRYTNIFFEFRVVVPWKIFPESGIEWDLQFPLKKILFFFSKVNYKNGFIK